MKFRCCGNQATLGHASDCPLKPTADEEPIDPQPVAEGFGRAGDGQGESTGCQFDILDFDHIGECQGTCGDQSEKIRFGTLDEDGEIISITIIEVDLTDPADMEKLMEKLKEMAEKREIRLLTEEETRELVTKMNSGEIKVEIRRTTLDEFLKEMEPKPKPDDPYITIKEAAEALGFSLGWTRTLCRKGRLPGAIKLMRKWAIPRSAIFEEEQPA